MYMNISNIKHFISLCNTRIATDSNLAPYKALFTCNANTMQTL